MIWVFLRCLNSLECSELSMVMNWQLEVIFFVTVDFFPSLAVIVTVFLITLAVIQAT